MNTTSTVVAHGLIWHLRESQISVKKDFELILKPILVGRIFNTINPSVYKARNNPNPVKEKLTYYFKDLKDLADARKIVINHDGFGPLNSPKVFPVNSIKAMRGSFMFIDEED